MNINKATGTQCMGNSSLFRGRHRKLKVKNNSLCKKYDFLSACYSHAKLWVLVCAKYKRGHINLLKTEVGKLYAPVKAGGTILCPQVMDKKFL